MTKSPLRPICLLADSILLFSKKGDGSFYLAEARALLSGDDPLAVYLGVSNEDRPEYFELFKTAMANIGIERSVHLRHPYGAAAFQMLRSAKLILLAGGDPIKGWAALQQSGMAECIREQYRAGALLMGISAGAIQLGMGTLWKGFYTPMLQLLPYYFDAHQEKDNWQRLRKELTKAEVLRSGIGIHSGGGIWFHPDGTKEIMGRASIELIPAKDADTLSENVLK
ncbi:MAG: Type 1 glutamine amidotransferase-like domain-containing protein [Bacteroidota bacterium]